MKKTLIEERKRILEIMSAKKIKEHVNENEISNFSNITQETDIEEIFKYIIFLPNKFTLSTRWGDLDKLYNSGLETALNNSRITRFYLDCLRKNKKTSKLLPTPDLDSGPYNKINDLIKIIDEYQSKIPSIDYSQSKLLLSLSDDENKDMNLKLFRSICFQLMNALLYENYFSMNIFQRRNVHDIVGDIKLPDNENEFWELFKVFTDKKSPNSIETILFFADSIPIIRTIEKYD